MVNIKGQRVTLRAVEPSDIEALYEWENDVDMWGVSGTTAPFSHYTLSLFIEAQREDIFTSRQMRLMICCSDSGLAVGAVDLFEFDPVNHRVGVGIMIATPCRRAGYASDALVAVEQYAASYLQVHQIWCNVESDNLASIALFNSLGYREIGVKQDWNASPNGYKSEIMMQRILL